MSKSGTKPTTGSQPTPLPLRMVISALGGMGAASVCHPTDVVRVQMQIFKFNGPLHATRAIYQDAGIIGLYNGITAAYLRQTLYTSCRLGLFSFLLEREKDAQLAAGVKEPTVSFSKKLTFGLISGGIGSFIGNPAEIAIVRMGADSSLPKEQQRNYKHSIDVVMRTANEEGVLALWRGVVPTVMRAMLLSASTQAVYSEAKLALHKSSPTMFPADSTVTMFSGTLFASLVANIVCTPFDVVKSRLQNMPVPKPGEKPLYTGMVDCFMQGIRAEGPTFMYRGFTPAFIKLAPYTTISIILVDKMTTLITGKSAY